MGALRVKLSWSSLYLRALEDNTVDIAPSAAGGINEWLLSCAAAGCTLQPAPPAPSSQMNWNFLVPTNLSSVLTLSDKERRWTVQGIPSSWEDYMEERRRSLVAWTQAGAAGSVNDVERAAGLTTGSLFVPQKCYYEQAGLIAIPETHSLMRKFSVPMQDLLLWFQVLYALLLVAVVGNVVLFIATEFLMQKALSDRWNRNLPRLVTACVGLCTVVIAVCSIQLLYMRSTGITGWPDGPYDLSTAKTCELSSAEQSDLSWLARWNANQVSLEADGYDFFKLK